MNNTLKAELVEVFTEQVTDSIRATFAHLVKTFGENMKGVANSRQYHVWRETIRPCCDLNGNRVDSAYSLNEERLAKFVAILSAEMADEVLAKVDAKVGELENPGVVRVSGANFLITGTKCDMNVVIEQNQIINVSVKGKLFNQYPSRIYVDGKFMSAAKFAKI